jgi:hypothetical protein
MSSAVVDIFSTPPHLVTHQPPPLVLERWICAILLCGVAFRAVNWLAGDYTITAHRNAVLEFQTKKRQTSWPAVFLQIWEEERLAFYLPDLAGAETGAGLEFSNTECEPPDERT